MTKQSETYVALKPISERFSKVANEITDAEIKDLIKDAMRGQLKSVVDFCRVAELIENFVESHEAKINEMIMDSLKAKL